MSLLTFDCDNFEHLKFTGKHKGMPCKKITEDFCIDFTRSPHVGLNYDHGLAGDYIVNDNGRLEIFTEDQVERFYP